MDLTIASKSEGVSAHMNTRLNAIRSCFGSCGLILIVCDIANKQLRALKKFLVKESGIHQPRLLYNESSQVITIVYEGMTLSTTHWIGLAVKSYMKEKFALEHNVLVANFAQAEYPQSSELGKMVRMLKVEANVGDSLIVYKAQSLDVEKERIVLIIEDDIVAGDFLKVQLESIGYQVHQAYDGVQGISSYDEISPDVVITELNLPALDGLQVIRHIRSNDEMNTRIIVLSEQRLDKDILNCLNLGVTEYITKPYSPADLELILIRMLEETMVRAI